jgi:hypothetical protein
VSGQLHAPTALPPGKEPPLDRRLGGPQSRSGRFGEEKILDPSGTRTPTTQSSSPRLVAIPITLSRLLTEAYMYINILNICLANDMNVPVSSNTEDRITISDNAALRSYAILPRMQYVQSS